MASGQQQAAAARRASVARPAVTAPEARVSAEARAFVELFYPVHYKIGIGIEDALRGGLYTRHQVAILWLIRSEGEDGRCIARKDIERSITRWFEIGNSAISKTLRAMARAPYRLLEIREHPLSGRERQVVLTQRGVDEINAMVERGRRFVQTMVDRLTAVEAANGVQFLGRVSEIIDEVEPAAREAGGGARGKPRSRRRVTAVGVAAAVQSPPVAPGAPKPRVRAAQRRADAVARRSSTVLD